MPAKKLDLFVPEAVAGSLSSLYVQSTSADLAVSGFSAEALEIHETSGTTELSDIRGDLTSIHSTSGKISISGLEASRLSMSSVSGDITLWDAAADAVTSGTTSGSQHLEGKFNTLELSSVSGEIGVVSAENPDSIQGKTVSGGICVTIPGKDNLEVSSSTVSGRFTTEVPVINAGGTPAYHFSSVSGNINILKYKG